MRTAPYYERVISDEKYENVQQVSCFKHYVAMIIHNVDASGQVVSTSDTSIDRMSHKIMIFDLIWMREL